ncbi:MAG: DNA-processing protein DprA [Gemmatimonadales bacterium]
MSMNRDARAAWVALALTPGIGPQRFAALLSATETPHGALSAPFAFLCTIPGISRACASAIKARSLADGERVLAQVDSLGARCLLPADPEFPPSLLEIPDAPVVLFATRPPTSPPGPLSGGLTLTPRPPLPTGEGETTHLLPSPAGRGVGGEGSAQNATGEGGQIGWGEMVAIVGSRDHTAYGAEVCRAVAGAAARAGLTVVSGMARGLDAIAHQAALDAGGATIGVLGNGLGVIYPAANRALYTRVGEEGLLLTEFPPGERPHAGSFPRRNRLISGLARVVVIIEAAATSGALVTVECALAQGKEVLAVPGPITSRASVGVNRLIRDGAAPLLEPADLLNLFPGIGPQADELPVVAAPVSGRTPEEQAVMAELVAAGIHLDQLVAILGRPVGAVLGLLLDLELAGFVEQLPGRIFRPAGVS